MKIKYLLNRRWYEHLTPREFHSHFPHFDFMFREYLGRYKRPALGWDAAGMAGKPVKLKVGDSEPVFHFIAMMTPKGWYRFAIPPDKLQKIESNARCTVAGKSFDIKDTNEIYIMPTFRLEIVTDQYFFRQAMQISMGANRQTSPPLEPYKITNPSILFSSDVGNLVTNKITHGEHSKPPKFVLYQHMFGDNTEYPMNGPFYVGITRRDWKRRWGEHRAAINRGSPLKFHRVFRERRESGLLTHVHHKIMGAVDDLEMLQQLERDLVEGHWHDKRLLNMRRGG